MDRLRLQSSARESLEGAVKNFVSTKAEGSMEGAGGRSLDQICFWTRQLRLQALRRPVVSSALPLEGGTSVSSLKLMWSESFWDLPPSWVSSPRS